MKQRTWALTLCAAVVTAFATLSVPPPVAGSAEPPAAAATPSIAVTPSAGLVSGQVVTVTGTGFTPSAQVVLSDCLTSTTIGFCGGIPPDSLIADGSGAFTYEFRVARGAFDESVYPPPLVDCAQAPGLCSVFAFVGGATEQRASTPISFDASVPPPAPVVTVTPTGIVTDGETLVLQGTGFTPNSNIVAGQCALGHRADFLASPCNIGVLSGVADPGGNVSVSVTITQMFPLTLLGSTVDCATAPGRCFVRITSMAEPFDTVDIPLVFAGTPAAPIEVTPAFTG
ncbi:MAG: neocarzinostatin apoprotein domain-containing protein [Acidimicrobiia bacterium]